MIVFERVAEMRDWVTDQQRLGKSLSFVPTMGALHMGHISLITRAKSESDAVVSSIFVNPTQFNNAEDLQKYPRTLSRDIDMLRAAGCDVLFSPSVEEMYPQGLDAAPVDYGPLTSRYEAAHRPGHFDGVVAIVRKLFHAVPAQRAYFGEKDLQQLRVIQTMVEREHIGIQIIPCPTVREASGLAMSSRNQRLSTNGLLRASSVYTALKSIASSDHWQVAMENQRTKLQKVGFEVEYLNLIESTTFDDPRGTSDMAVIFAGVLEGVRLIDNFKIGSGEED